MTNFFVDSTNGSDANNGLGPDASAGTNKPWKTIGKLLGATGMASGDTGYLAPGFFREVVTVAMTAPTAETKIIGDPGNAQGFKTSGGVRVTPGDVEWTACTTNDKTVPSGSPTVTLAGRPFLTFDSIVFAGGTAATASCYDANTTGSHDVKFLRCTLKAGTAANNPALGRLTLAVDTAAHWLFDSCTFLMGVAMVLSAPRPSAADLDVDVVIQNSRGFVFQPFTFTVTGANTFKWGGAKVYNCTWFAGTNWMSPVANMSTTFPCLAYNNILWGCGNTCFNANAASQITEDWNLIYGFAVARTNTSTGAHSQTNTYSPRLECGEAEVTQQVLGRWVRPFGVPKSGSGALGFGGQSVGVTTDLLSGPRPAGGQSPSNAVGAFERADSFGLDGSPIGGGGSAIKITGPGYNDFLVPVPAAQVTISVKVKWDATYAGTKPQIMVLANARIGVTAQTVTATGAAVTTQTITLASFTPTVHGLVFVRLQSNDTNGAGVLQADDFLVTSP